MKLPFSASKLKIGATIVAGVAVAAVGAYALTRTNVTKAAITNDSMFPITSSSSLVAVTSVDEYTDTGVLTGASTSSIAVGLITQGGGNTNGVDVHVQLLQNGALAGEAVYHNTGILHEAPQTFWLSLGGIPNGTYTVAVMIDNPDGSVNAAFGNLGSIVVTGSTVTPTPSPSPSATPSVSPTPSPSPSSSPSVSPTPTPTPSPSPSSTPNPSSTAALMIVPTTLHHGTVNVGYSQTLTASSTGIASGTFFNWTIASGTLPTGLSLNTGISSTTATITGTPTTSGATTFAIGVNDGGTNSSTQMYTLTIGAASTTSTSTTSGNLAVYNVYMPKNNLTAGNTAVTITPYLISQNGANVGNVAVQVALVQNGTVVDSQTYGNQDILHEYPQAYPLTTVNNLPVGNYQLAVTVYNADNTVNASFPNLGTVTVQ